MTKRVWHVGNWCIHTGNEYIESPFLSAKKNVEVLNYGQPFVDAIQEIDGAEVISQPSWELYNLSPEAFDDRLQWADVIVFGDVETKCMMLHPDFFNRAKWETGYVTYPDRFNVLRRWVEAGGHFHMNGGWYSFSGQLGKGGWGRSLFADVLPVQCLETDDLFESTEAFPTQVNQPNHPAVSGIDFDTLPPLLGFNQTIPREGCGSIVDIAFAGNWHPLFAAHHFGEGRVTAWTTGASPHWGINFVKWPQYNQFWRQVFTADY
ncbi:glutamine amidotransferase [Neorhodopirellula lusitana]|nr:glutamine amidotransferase [Neorhodopirellula lusitana]